MRTGPLGQADLSCCRNAYLEGSPVTGQGWPKSWPPANTGGHERGSCQSYRSPGRKATGRFDVRAAFCGNLDNMTCFSYDLCPMKRNITSHNRTVRRVSLFVERQSRSPTNRFAVHSRIQQLLCLQTLG